jgi:hypothetical protein
MYKVFARRWHSRCLTPIDSTTTMKHIHTSVAIAVAGLLVGTAPKAAAFPATKDSAEATLTFNLLPVGLGSGTSSGKVVIDVTRASGVSTSSPLEVSFTGLVNGTYTVTANLKSDPSGATPVAIGPIAVSATPIVPAPAALTLPAGLDPFSIGAITVSDATPAIILSGLVTETITKWTYMGNQPVTSPIALTPPEGHGPKPKKLHGHVLIQSKIVDGVELKRKFLLVAQGATADATLTIKLDGVAVGSVVATKSGKLMLKSLEGDFRLAGTHLVTITDAAGVVVAQADFFPTLQ